MSGRWLSAGLAVCLALSLAGCVRGGAGAGGAAGGGADSASTAVAAADTSMKAVAPDAVLISVSSGGVVLAPPPTSWTMTYVSPSKGTVYRVAAEHGTAKAPETVAALKVPPGALDSVLPYSQLSVGSDEAYASAVALLKASGAVPPQLMMGVTLYSLPQVPGSKPGIWSLTFMTGTSTQGARRVTVDGRTGEAKEQTRSP